MRVNSFTVEGYKNLSTAVTFGPLGAVSALHGPNNVGKSNLLAALDLFFGLLAVNTNVSKDQSVSLDENEQIEGHPFAEIFNVTDPTPIRLQAELSLPKEELQRSGLEPECETDPTTITLELTPVVNSGSLRVTQFQMGAQDVARDSSGPVGFGESLRAFISGTLFSRTDRSMRPFALIDPYRTAPEEASVPGLVPQWIRDDLFDARQALDRDQRARWGLFQTVMQLFQSELGPGEFDTSFNRATGRANLVYLSPTSAMPVDRLGAGSQRLIALLGSLVLSRASLVGLSEPELGLSPSGQARLLAALNLIMAAPGGPSQVLVTTHSPVLGGIESAFLLEAGEAGLAVVQRPCDGAVTVPSVPSQGAMGGGPAPGDLDQLIGLVDQLSEIEPEALVGTAAGAKGGPGRKADTAAPDGTPPWKVQAGR